MEEHLHKKKAARLEAVSVLLEHGADPNATDGRSASPVVTAAAFGSPEIVKLLLERGAIPSSPGRRLGCALQAACARGGVPVEWCVSPAHPEDYTEVQEVLLRNVSQVDYVGGIYSTALEAAAFLDDMDEIPSLLVKGADPSIRAGACGSAVGAAIDQGHVRAMKRLLDAGACINASHGAHSGDDWYKRKLEPISSLFLAHGAPLPSNTAPVEQQNVPDLENPAVLAYQNGHFDIVRMLPGDNV